MTQHPETVLQFGSGRFLRGFADIFLHQANLAGHAIGSAVVVQSTASQRADLLNAQQGRYHLLVQGVDQGEIVDRLEESASVSRALVAQTDWDAVLEVACSPQLRVVLSNTTEAGFALHPTDTLESAPPHSFPAKLLTALHARFKAELTGLEILPCELLEGNADRLLGILLGLAEAWKLAPEFTQWLLKSCRWRNTLVDRIVTDAPPTHPLLAQDKLLIAAEPFALWVIEQEASAPHWLEHPACTYTTNATPYFLRKVRILNGAHTAMAPKALAKGYQTVKQAMEDPEILNWLEGLLFEEIVPVLQERVQEPVAFAQKVLERFANPFLEHKIANIMVYHTQKQQTRLQPTLQEYRAQFGTTPRRLAEALEQAQP